MAEVSARKSLIAIVALLLAFATLVIVGAVVNDSYRHSRDYVSSLAGRGVEQPWIGMLGFACFAAAHAVAAMRWRRTSRIVFATLLACCALILVVAAARSSCPGGAAGCSLPDRPSVTDVGDAIHALGIGVYVVAYVFAAICAGVVLVRRRHRWLGVTMFLLAVLSVLAVGQIDEQSPGAEQRIWLAVNAVGLVALGGFAASAAARDPRSAEETGD